MAALVNALLQFFQPVVVFFVSVVSIIGFLLGALANPQGLMNKIVCGVIDGIATILPSTPNNLKIAYLIDSIASSMPAVGRGIIREFFITITAMFAIVAVIKIYKLLPFKAS